MMIQGTVNVAKSTTFHSNVLCIVKMVGVKIEVMGVAHHQVIPNYWTSFLVHSWNIKFYALFICDSVSGVILSILLLFALHFVNFCFVIL